MSLRCMKRSGWVRIIEMDERTFSVIAAAAIFVVLRVTLFGSRLLRLAPDAGPEDCFHGAHVVGDPTSPVPKEGDVIELRCARNATTGEFEVWGRVK